MRSAEEVYVRVMSGCKMSQKNVETRLSIPYSLVYECLQRRICIVVTVQVDEDKLFYFFRRDDHGIEVPMKKIECFKLSPAYLGDVYKLLGKSFTFPSFQAHLEKMTNLDFSIEGWINSRSGMMATIDDRKRAYDAVLRTYYGIVTEIKNAASKQKEEETNHTES